MESSSDPPNPEQESRNVLSLLSYLLTALKRPIPPDVADALADNQGDPENLPVFSALLSQTLAGLSPKENWQCLRDKFNPMADKLALWWDDYKKQAIGM